MISTIVATCRAVFPLYPLEQMESPPVFDWVRIASVFSFRCCVFYTVVSLFVCLFVCFFFFFLQTDEFECPFLYPLPIFDIIGLHHGRNGKILQEIAFLKIF